MHSEYDSVTQQAGLWAGDGGFQVRVGDNTTLAGGVIASSQQAVADALNSLSTGTLVVRDIENRADYSASQVAVGGGVNFGGGGNDLGTTKDNEVAGGATKEHGTSVPSTGGGLGLGMPVVAAANGDASSTTQSAISDGAIEIRDEAGQKALTGQTADQAVASVNWDTSDTLNTLDPIFDKEQIEAGFEIVSEASWQLGQFLANRAKEVDLEARAIKKEIAAELAKEDSADPARLAALNAQLEQTRQWAPGSTSRQALTAILAAASGNVTGSTSQFALNAALGYLQAEGAKLVKQLADALPQGAESETLRAALHGVLACGSAAAQGVACGSGAAGASLSSVLGYLLKPEPGATAEEVEARSNLLNGLVAGVITGLGGDAATTSAAARIEADNNTFYRNRTSVAKETAAQRAELEQALLSGQISNEAYEKNIKTLDASSAKIDALMTLYDVQSASGLSQVLGQMSSAHVALLADAVGGLLAVPGMAGSAYELITGHTVASQEEANYFFAVLGVVGGGVGKAVGKLGDLAKVLSDAPKVEHARQLAAAQATKGTSLISDARADHILHGDGTGGGHLWPGAPGKSTFPQSGSSTRVLDEINSIASDPLIPGRVQGNGRIVKEATIDGVNIRVVVEPPSKGGGVVTGFPTNVPRNPK